MTRIRLAPYLLIAPSVLFLTVLFIVPLLQTIALAFQDSGGWGTGNFRRMAGDLNFNDAVIDTFEIVVLAVPLQLALAIGHGDDAAARRPRPRHRAVDLVDPARHLRPRGRPRLAGDPERPGLPQQLPVPRRLDFAGRRAS